MCVDESSSVTTVVETTDNGDPTAAADEEVAGSAPQTVGAVNGTQVSHRLSGMSMAHR